MLPDLDSFITKFGGWTESYWFYGGTVELRYDMKEHLYLLVNGDELEPQAGVTSICHIIDKSEALLPWACKMMAQKLLATVPVVVDRSGIDTLAEPVVFLSQSAFTDLVMQAKSAHKEKLEDAGYVGNVAHNWIEQYIKCLLSTPIDDSVDPPPLPADDRARNCCTAALDWMAKHRVRWISTERKIYSRSHRYAGTMDGLCYVSSCGDPLCCTSAFTDRLSVADWKSSNHLYMEYMLQTAAYEAAYEEEHGVDIQDRWVIRLGKDDGEFEPWHMEADCFNEDFGAFLMALALSRSVDSIKLRIKTKEQDKRTATRLAVAEAKAAVKARLAEEKTAARAAKKQAVLDALKIKCKGSDRYKAVRRPRCNGGNPCQACIKKYEDRHSCRNTSMSSISTASPPGGNIPVTVVQAEENSISGNRFASTALTAKT